MASTQQQTLREKYSASLARDADFARHLDNIAAVYYNKRTQPAGLGGLLQGLLGGGGRGRGRGLPSSHS